MSRNALLALGLFVFITLMVFGCSDTDADTTVKIDGLDLVLAEDHTARLTGFKVQGELIIPETVTYDGSEYTIEVVSIYNRTDTITKLVVPGTVKDIEAESFRECRNLRTAVIGEGTQTIGPGAFALSGLTDLTLPSTIRMIENGAFANTYIEKFKVPRSTYFFHSAALTECEHLKTITVAEGNPEYRAIDNTLYSADGKELLFHISGPSHFIIPDGVESIGKSAFNSDYKLRSVEIPDTVSSIGNNAFRYCTSLESIVIPEGVTVIQGSTFDHCTSLKTVTFPESLIAISVDAFSNCALTGVSFGSQLESIGLSFADCDSLATISVSGDNSHFKAVDNVLFTKDGSELIWYPENRAGDAYTVPAGTTNLRQYSFYSANLLKDVFIPDGVTIDPQAFLNGSVENVRLPEDLKILQPQVFFGCKNLRSVSIPRTVSMIGEGCFFGCTSLTAVSISQNVTFMGDMVFKGCTALETVDFQASIEKLPVGSFMDCTSLKSFTMPDGTTQIGSGAFRGCTALETIDLRYAYLDANFAETPFENCPSIKTITVAEDNDTMRVEDGVLIDTLQNGIALYPAGDERKSYTVPDGIVYILSNAFSHASNLVTVTLSDTVKEMWPHAFSYCSNLAEFNLGKLTAVFDAEYWLGCPSLKTVTVAKGNELVYVEDGVLFTIDGNETILSLYPAAKEGRSYTVPSGVYMIFPGAFAMSKLESIDMGTDAMDLCDRAFYKCESLKNITLLPGSAIGSACFEGCLSLESIYLPADTRIFSEAFINCPSLRNVTLEDEIKLTENSIFAIGANPDTGVTKVIGFHLDSPDSFIIPSNHLSYEGKVAAEVTYGETSDPSALWIVIGVVIALVVVGFIVLKLRKP